jgi:hypothetical protein
VPTAAPPTTAYQSPPGATEKCVNGFRNVLLDLRPAASFDYIELRQRFDANNGKVLLAAGRVCASAADPSACRNELDPAGSAGFGSSCHPGHCDFNVVVTDASGVRRLVTADDVATFLGPIDTPSEALLMAFARGHWVLGCEGPMPVKDPKGYALTVTQMVEECPVVNADVSFAVGRDGSVRVVGTTNRKKSNACVGRRPPGLHPAVSDASSPVGEYLARSAHLEAASVLAFERVRSELRRLGAPARLLRSCRRAASDERRHARKMGELCAAHGGRNPALRVSRLPLRDAEALALDNAVEGCVRETYGAVVGMHQARSASDPNVRAALASIAEDEVRHAALAWKIAAWLEPRLDTAVREKVERARREALRELREELADEPEPALATSLGLPSARTALDMLHSLERTLFARKCAAPARSRARARARA